LVFVAACQLAGAEDGYLESGACAECHSQIAASYARTGMARSLGLVSAGAAVPAGTFRHDPSEQLFAVSRRGGKTYLKRQQTGLDGSPVNIMESEMRYSIGSGLHASSYFGQTASGKLIDLPLTWYSEKGGYWAMSPGFDRPDHSGFSRKVTADCLFCHTGYLDARSQFKGQPVEGVDCQRCHGKVETMDRVRQVSNLSMGWCVNCHRETATNGVAGKKVKPSTDCSACHY